MNELLKIAELLENKYGDNSHFLITKAEKTENGWNLTIQPAKENGGAANDRWQQTRKEKQPTGENGSM